MTPYTSASGRVYQTFTKSTRSTGGANCVEVGLAADGIVALRDSKNPAGPVIEMPSPAFREFLDSIKEGAFDL